MRATAAFFSLSAGLPTEAETRAYLAWHQLDHMPEQYQLPGILLGQRWRLAKAIASVPPWDRVEHLVLYLMGDPLEHTLDGFMALGRQLREAGRYPVALPPVFVGATEVVDASASSAAVVSDVVVPWRPHRGVYLLVEETPPAKQRLLDLPGVAGVWTFATSERLGRWQRTPGRFAFSVAYLDRPLSEVVPGLEERLGGDPVLLGAAFEVLAAFSWE